MLAHEAVPLFQRQRGLLAFTDCRMAGAELAQRLPCESGHRDFLVIEPGDNASICLLLEGTMQLAEDKVLTAHSFIKVMNNRIIPFHAVSNQLLRLA